MSVEVMLPGDKDYIERGISDAIAFANSGTRRGAETRRRPNVTRKLGEVGMGVPLHDYNEWWGGRSNR